MNKLFIVTLFILCANRSLAEISMEIADKSIANTHLAARLFAHKLLMDDFNELITQLSQSVKTFKNNQQTSEFDDQIKTRLEAINSAFSLIKKADSLKSIDEETLRSLERSYSNIVKERFHASYQLQAKFYSRDVFIQNFSAPFERFRGLCKTGRSQSGFNPNPEMINNVKSTQFDFFISFGFQTDGKNLHPESLSYNSVRPFEGRTNMQNFNSSLAQSTSLLGSMAWSGSNSASALYAMKAFPYFVAVTAAAIVVTHIMDITHDSKTKSLAAEINRTIFINQANNRDVARYYSELCTEVTRALEPTLMLIHQFNSGGEGRMVALNSINQTAQDRLEFNSQLLNIATLTKKLEDKSLSQEEQEKHKNEISLFNAKFNQQQIAKFYVLDFFELAFDQERARSLLFSQNSFESIDLQLTQLNQKLNALTRQLRIQKNKKWASHHKLALNLESKLENEFFALRKMYFYFFKEAIISVFQTRNNKLLKQQFATFQTRLQVLFRAAVHDPDIRDFYQSSLNLGKFYEKF